MLEKNVSEASEITMQDSRTEAILNARHLWAALSAAHSDLNSIARRHASKPLSQLQRQTLQTVFQQVHELLGGHAITTICPLIDDQEELSSGEALIVVGQHRAALRIYRVDVLGEDAFTLHA